jgi:hypothetical protein
MKRQAIHYEKIFANHISDKGLALKISKKLFQLSCMCWHPAATCYSGGRGRRIANLKPVYTKVARPVSRTK